jgi:hypothetical protein
LTPEQTFSKFFFRFKSARFSCFTFTAIAQQQVEKYKHWERANEDYHRTYVVSKQSCPKTNTIKVIIDWICGGPT